MAKREIVIFIAFAAFAFASEVEDAEQKKRGAGKANVLNAIPTGAQKSDYTYSIYSQNPVQSNPSQAYQSQAPNSFYPNQVASQYYSSGNPADSSASVQPQISTVAQQSSHFAPLSFIPSSGYQQKYQIVPSKASNNVQVALLQPPTPYPTSSLLHYPQMILAANPTNHIAPHSPIYNGITPQHNFNFPHYQLPSFGHPFLAHPSAMVFVPQINPNVYNNLAYTSPSQGIANYYSSNSQSKQTYPSSALVSTSNEYEKQQSVIPQSSVSKEDNDLSGQSEYASADSSSAYKNTYNTGRNTYSKL